MSNTTRWSKHADVLERIVIEGQLRLLSPAHFGNGDFSDLLDAPIARDGQSGAPLLSGASLAGALRARLAQHSTEIADALFGYARAKETLESALFVHDAYGSDQQTELRDGVRLDPVTRTAADRARYDIELTRADTCFPLRFELTVSRHDKTNLVEAMAIALGALERGEISLGKRKTRGFGACVGENWGVRRSDMRTQNGVLAWVNDEAPTRVDGSIVSALGCSNTHATRPLASLRAKFALAGSLLIRTESGDPNDPDMVHLRSQRNGKAEPVLSASSLVGALRARAMRTLYAIRPDAGANAEFMSKLFGATALPLGISRIRATEMVIENAKSELVQQRVSIDRFTGGASNSALFSQMPAFGGKHTHVNVSIEVHQPNDADIGLLVLLLRDLWQGDLALGGEQSVGRGQLRGISADLTHASKTITVKALNDSLVVSDAPALQAFVDALHNALTPPAGGANGKTN